MARAVLDASALLALLNDEPGASMAADALDGEPVMSAVNLSEVVAKLVDAGIDQGEVRDLLDGLQIEVAAFDEDAAHEAGALRPATRRAGLSFGDRACLALGVRLGVPVLTADRGWRSLGLPVEVVVMR